MTARVATVRRCRPDEVLVLRHQVLRPHQRPEELCFPADTSPGAVHFCADGPEGQVICIASAWPEAPAWQALASPQWRLRAMATAPQWQGKGIGSAVLAAVVDHIAGLGGGLLWCNARLAAVAFYERAGMTTTGEPWEEPVIGPHVAMWRLVAPAGAAHQDVPAP